MERTEWLRYWFDAYHALPASRQFPLKSVREMKLVYEDVLKYTSWDELEERWNVLISRGMRLFFEHLYQHCKQIKNYY